MPNAVSRTEYHIEDVTSGEKCAVQHIGLKICVGLQVSSVDRDAFDFGSFAF